MIRALLIGTAPCTDLGFSYTAEAPYDGVVIGSLTLGQLLCFREERVLEALAQGKPVVLYTPGLPEVKGNRVMAARLASARRELQNLGVRFTDGARRHVVTAEEARLLRTKGERPGPGAVLTPLAKEILEGNG